LSIWRLFPLWEVDHPLRTDELRERRSCAGPGHIDEAKEHHIEELESLVSEYKAHIRSLETEVQELPYRPVLDQGSGFKAFCEELANETHTAQEARRGTSLRRLRIPSSWENQHLPRLLFSLALEEKKEATQKDGKKIEGVEQTTSCLVCGCSR
jgi:hypothetical protein